MGTRGLGCVWISGLRILAIGTDWDQRCGSIDGAKCLTPCLRTIPIYLAYSGLRVQDSP